jgi:hypothetical protein
MLPWELGGWVGRWKTERKLVDTKVSPWGTGGLVLMGEKVISWVAECQTTVVGGAE